MIYPTYFAAVHKIPNGVPGHRSVLVQRFKNKGVEVKELE